MINDWSWRCPGLSLLLANDAQRTVYGVRPTARCPRCFCIIKLLSISPITLRLVSVAVTQLGSFACPQDLSWPPVLGLFFFGCGFPSFFPLPGYHFSITATWWLFEIPQWVNDGKSVYPRCEAEMLSQLCGKSWESRTQSHRKSAAEFLSGSHCLYSLRLLTGYISHSQSIKQLCSCIRNVSRVAECFN